MASWEQSDYTNNRNTAAKELAEALGITQKKAKDKIDAFVENEAKAPDNPYSNFSSSLPKTNVDGES